MKQIINNAIEFAAEAEKRGYEISVRENIAENRYFNIGKNGLFLQVNFKRKKTSLYSYKPASVIGLNIRKPYELLRRGERVNFGEINIIFGKTTTEIFTKIDALMGEFQQQRKKEKEAKDNAAVIQGEILKVMKLFPEAVLDGLQGFYIRGWMNKNPLYEPLFQLGCETLYYSYEQKSFIFTPECVSNMKGNLKNQPARKPINMTEFDNFVKKVKQIQKEIDILNEKYFV